MFKQFSTFFHVEDDDAFVTTVLHNVNQKHITVNGPVKSIIKYEVALYVMFLNLNLSKYYYQLILSKYFFLLQSEGSLYQFN